MAKIVRGSTARLYQDGRYVRTLTTDDGIFTVPIGHRVRCNEHGHAPDGGYPGVAHWVEPGERVRVLREGDAHTLGVSEILG